MNNPRSTATALVLILIAAGQARPAPIRLRAGTIEPPPKAGLQAQSAAQARDTSYLVQFDGPVRPEWKEAVRQTGARLLDYVPENTFIVRMNSRQAGMLAEREFVRWVTPLAPDHRVEPGIPRAAETLDVVIRTVPDQLTAPVEEAITLAGGKLLGGASAEYLKARIPTRALYALSRLDEVLWIEEWLQPRTANNSAHAIVHAPEMRARLGLYGAGQTIAFADSGLDTGNVSTLSADFSGRIVAAYGLKRPGEWSDLYSHGTHVIGVAAGSGSLSGGNPAAHSYDGSFAGMAPEAGLVIQSIGDGTIYVYPPLNLNDLFQPALNDGARVHNDSWGSPSQGLYTSYSQQVDSFIWNHRDFVAVFPAGNDGRDGNSNGVTDLGSMYAPGTAKNCITVGATEGLRSTGRITTYYAAWPADFPANPLRDDYISDNPNGMVAWSGRGPCSDGRIKPDICAPGTNIVSARSHSALTQPWWVAYDANYAYWGGTSMSTPMVAGAAALVREHYVKNKGVDPSAALVKATLLNGAADITPGQYTPPYPAEVPARPNSVEGWGRLDISSVLDPPAPKVVEFVDDAAGLSTGQDRVHTYSVLGSSTRLCVTLVWTDPPGSPIASKQLVNDLNLTVTDPQSNVFRGNGVVDSTNNVEGVDIASPIPGTYTITVSAANVPTGPQPYALVVSGELPGSYVSGTAQTATGKPIAGATVTVTGGSSPKTTTTAANGAYTAHVVPGNYTVGIAKASWTFDPASQPVTVGLSGATGVDFTGSAPAGGIDGTVTQAIGGVVSYVLESPHPYYEGRELYYSITAQPDAPRIRVHFSDIAMEEGYDFLRVETPSGQMVNEYTGSLSDVWSSWVTGNSLRIRLTSDEMIADYGFYVDGYETDISTQGGVSGITLTALPGGSSTVSGPGGSFSITGIEPVTYTVSPSLARWTFSPTDRSVDVPPGGTASGVSFLAFPPAQVTGRVTTGTVVEAAQVRESPHPYPGNANLSYTVQGPPGATRIRAHFERIDTEAVFDWVYVTDMDGNIVEVYTGSYSDVWSPWVNGSALKVLLTSDGDTEDYGFRVDRYAASTDERGAKGVTVTLQPLGLTAVTDNDGYYTVSGVEPGQHSVTASKPYWIFDPASRDINAVSGLATGQVDFVGHSSALPGIAYAKSLSDGEEVLLTSQTVTAGSDRLQGCFYIESADRTNGIKVAWSQAVAQGAVVTVQGTLRTVNGERQIDARTVAVGP